MHNNRSYRRGLDVLCTAGIALLVVLCVVGAFQGGRGALRLFGSPPAAALWALVAGMLVVRLADLAQAARTPGTSAMLLGALLVVLGGLWGSPAGHRILRSGKIPRGSIRLVRGHGIQAVQVADGGAQRLDFDLKLQDVRTERLAPVSDAPGAEPAPERYDVEADVSVVANGREVARQVIRVNHPLHYGGYHFYLGKSDVKGGRYADLLAVSDSGLLAVYCGLILLAGGVAFAFWARPAWRRLREVRQGGH